MSKSRDPSPHSSAAPQIEARQKTTRATTGSILVRDYFVHSLVTTRAIDFFLALDHPSAQGKSTLIIALIVALWSLFLVERRGDTTDHEHLPPFHVQDLPDRGKGVIASRDIQRGELLIRESPLFMVPQSISSSPTEFIFQRVRELSPEQSETFYNLSYVHLPENLTPDARNAQLPLAIFQTNAVAAGAQVGLFPTMARLNHGCSFAFNVVYSWRSDEGVLVVHALKDIRKGEELLTTYTDTKKSRDERRAYLKQLYDFECTCACCALPNTQSASSDKRLSTMSELYGQLATWGHGRIDGREAIRLVKQIWSTGEEEGYTSERGQLAADAATVALTHSDASAAIEWAQVAVQWGSYELGADSALVAAMRRAAAEPGREGMWGAREKLEVGGPEDLK